MWFCDQGSPRHVPVHERHRRRCGRPDRYKQKRGGVCKPDQRTILAVWVLLRFIDYVDPMAHYPAVYPSQIFFLKENTGYEIVVLYDGEQHLSKLLQPQDDEMKYIFVLPNIAMASQMMLPKAPCLFATVNFAGQEEPDITFYTEEVATDGLDKLVHSSAG